MSTLSERDIKRTEKFWQLYEKLFQAKRPKGWKVEWHVQGRINLREKVIYLAADSMRDHYDLETVIHEMVHLQNPQLPHGKRYDRLVKDLIKNVVYKSRSKSGRRSSGQGAES